MNYYTYVYKNKEGEEKELKLRLTSSNAIEIENVKKMSVTSYLQQESIEMIVTLLRYLLKWEDKNFSFGQAQQLYDELIDSGLTMKKILTDIIYETLVVSGFLEKEEWEEMKKIQQKMTEKAKNILSQE